MVLQFSNEEKKKYKSQDDESKDPDQLWIHTSLIITEDYDFKIEERIAEFVFESTYRITAKIYRA